MSELSPPHGLASHYSTGYPVFNLGDLVSFLIAVTKYLRITTYRREDLFQLMILEVVIHGPLTLLLWPVVRQSIRAEGIWWSTAAYLMELEAEREEKGARDKKYPSWYSP